MLYRTRKTYDISMSRYMALLNRLTKVVSSAAQVNGSKIDRSIRRDL